VPERIGAHLRKGNWSERISLQDTSTTAPVLLTTGEVKRDYEEMALISAAQAASYSYGSTPQQLNEILRDKAREMGANAVVRIQYYFGRFGFIYALGTAVKYK
jgi:uncharacterized protein YbjQ (UPF0145 family)